MIIFKKIKFIALIFRNSSKINTPSLPILRTYLKLLLKLIVFKVFKVRFNNEIIFNFKILCFDYEVLVSLFEAIFIEHEYYFPYKDSNPKIIDVGSNIGMSILYFKYMFKNSKIIAFEPDPKTFALLKETIKINKFSNVIAYDIALSDKKGMSFFYNDLNNPGSLLMSLNKDRTSQNRINVKTDKLSSYISGSTDLLKIDAEGAEEEIISDLHEKGSFKRIANLIFEYHHHININQDKFSKSLSVIENEGFGYQIVSKLRSPIKNFLFQDILVYAKKK